MFQCPQCSLACSESHVPNITIMKYVEAMNNKSEERVRSNGEKETVKDTQLSIIMRRTPQ